jgi:hypothetical protein
MLVLAWKSPWCCGSCFLNYTAESSLMAAIIPKEALCQEENIKTKTQCSICLREGLGHSKPAPNPWNKHKQHNCGDLYYIHALLIRLL